uniref:Uncharacterized protein n=1 Tax=Rhizophora mucronata TaxID=61149 RepID=A0A2P2P6A2_RHIMU
MISRSRFSTGGAEHCMSWTPAFTSQTKTRSVRTHSGERPILMSLSSSSWLDLISRPNRQVG